MTNSFLVVFHILDSITMFVYSTEGILDCLLEVI